MKSKRNNNSTLELNDCSLPNTRCGAEKQRSENTDQGDTYKRKVHFLENAGKEHVNGPKINGEIEGNLLPEQDRGRNRVRNSEGARSRAGRSLSRDRRETKSGHGKKATEQGALTFWGPQRGNKSGHEKKTTGKEALTFWGPQREDQHRTRKESDRTRDNHPLETAEGETSR